MRRLPALLLGAALALGAALPASAQAPLLYEQRLPDGFALIRYVNGTEAPLALRSEFDLPRQLGVENDRRVTPFHVMEDVGGKPISVDITAGGATTRVTFTVRSNSFNTLMILREGNAIVARPVEDTAEFNQLRARLTFYNASLTCGTQSLSLERGGQAVLADVEAARMRARTVAPAAARVVTQCAGSRVGPLDLGRLEAGQLTSVFLIAPGGVPALFAARDLIAPPGR